MTTTTKFGSYKNQYGKWVQDRGPSPKQAEWIKKLSTEKQLTPWMDEKIAAAYAGELSGRDASTLLDQLFAAKNLTVSPSKIQYQDGQPPTPKQDEWIAKLMASKAIPESERAAIETFQADGLTRPVASKIMDYLFSLGDQGTEGGPQGFLGEKGDLITVTGKITTFQATLGTYGPTNMIVVTTQDNKAVKMWSNAKGFAGKKVGDEITLSGTVRDHDNYKGQQATVISRPKVGG